jgi:hypothetical protein
MSAAGAADVINACEAEIRAAVPIATRIYVEPAAASDAPIPQRSIGPGSRNG